jgi:hypothetical protein
MTMSSNEINSRKSRYSDKFDENSSLCNRSLKSEFNNLSVDLPHHHHKQKHSSIEREIIGRRANKSSMTINLACMILAMQSQSTPFFRRSARRRLGFECKTLERLVRGS